MSALIGCLSKKHNESIDFSDSLTHFPGKQIPHPLNHPPFFSVVLSGQNNSPNAHTHHDLQSNVACLVDGEIYAGPHFNNENPAQYLCNHYLKTNQTWHHDIQGCFSCAIWDPKHQKLFLLSDPSGLRPLYFSHTDNQISFSTRISALTSLLNKEDRKLNWTALSDFFKFENVLGTKTWIQSITRLHGGQELLWHKDKIHIKNLWSLSTFDRDISSNKNLLNNVGTSFLNTLDLYKHNAQSLGVYLTSGLDSRMIAGGLKQQGDSFSCFNYGIQGSRDSVWGQALAKNLKAPFTYFPLSDGKWVSELFDEYVMQTEGHVNGLHMHGMNTYKQVGSQIDVHLSGHGGGSFLGGDTSSHSASKAQDISQIKSFMIDHYANTLGNVFRDDSELKNLLTPDTADMIQSNYQQSFHEEFECHTHHPIDNIGDSFILANRYHRIMAHMIAAERAHFECRTPFMDHHFLENVFSVPITQRLSRNFQIDLLNHLFPSAAKIPWQATCLPPTHNSRLIWQHIIFRKLHRMFGPLIGRPHQLPTEPGRNYPLWVYQDCLPWLEENLNVLEEQPFFKWDHVRNFVKDFSTTMKTRSYQEQRTHIYKISAIFTWLKTWQNLGKPL